VVVVEDGARRSDLLRSRVREFCQDTDVDALGIFRIPADALAHDAVDPELAPALRSFLPRLSGGDALSRGERYYDVRSSLLAWPALLAACRRLTAAEERADRRTALALHENLFNVIAAMTFSYWERCCDEPECVDERGPVLASLVAILPEVAGLHLSVALGRDVTGGPPSVDWAFLESVGTRFPRQWPLRTLREFDSKPRVLNEVLYLGHEVRAMWPFQTVLFPLYGALTLAAYFRAVEGLDDASSDGPAPSVLIRLGLYDRGESTYRTPEGRLDVDRLLPRPWLDDARRALRGSMVLVVDDNAATGRTLRACREFVLQCGGVPMTRSAETSWELLERHHGDRPSFEGVDLPGLRANMSNALHRSLVELLLRRRWDLYAQSAERLDRTDFSAGLLENYRTARRPGTLLPHQRWSVEHEWAHARQHWREPGYPSAQPSSDGRAHLPYDGYPDGVRPWSLTAPADVSHTVPSRRPDGLSVVGVDSFVFAAGSVKTVRIVVPGAGRLRLQIGGWSTLVAISADGRRPGVIDVEVMAPITTGGHQLILQFSAPGKPLAERRYPVHLVAPVLVDGPVRLAGGGSATAEAIRRTGAVVERVDPAVASASTWERCRPGTTLVIGEGALEPATGAALRAAMTGGATALVLAQEPRTSRELPLPACLESLPLKESWPVRFTTGHHALTSLPRSSVLSFEDAAMLPNAVFTRLGNGTWASDVAVGVLAADGSFRGTVVGAHDVGTGRLIVCQLRLAAPAAAGHPGAGAVLADLLRWAVAPPRPLEREDVMLSDGRSMTFYPFPGAGV
jgi:hypothetical protein